MSITPTEQAAANRALASRARRLASQLSACDASAKRLLDYAEELDVQAVALERPANEGG
jgi:hypothetical protein